MIPTVFDDQEELILAILSLHAPGGIELDCTYSKGVFYRGAVDTPSLRFDISPQVEGVLQACSTSLPVGSGSVSCSMFDPPFLATTGPSLKKRNGSNLIANRFSVFPSEPTLHEFYRLSLEELYRVTAKKGVLIFKCQDKVSSGKQYFSHCWIWMKAQEIGWYAKDLMILRAKSRMVPEWQRRNQIHARKFHSYFWVFEKISKRPKYTSQGIRWLVRELMDSDTREEARTSD